MTSDRPMPIGIDIRAAQLRSGERGIGRYIYDLINGLARWAPGPEYVLLSMPNAPLPPQLRELPTGFRRVEVPTEQLEYLDRLHVDRRRDPAKRAFLWKLLCFRNQWINAQALRKVVRREQLSLLHLTYTFDNTFFIQGKYSCPVVVTCHDAIPLVLPEQFLNIWPPQIRSVYLQQATFPRTADRVIAVSQSAARDVETYFGVAPDRIRVIYNSIASMFIRDRDAEDRDTIFVKYAITDRYFLCCGGGGPNKNRIRLVQAFINCAKSIAPDQGLPQLVFAGPDGGDTDEIFRIIRSAGLAEKRVRILGFIPDDDLVALFSGTIAIVMPSLYEGFGLPAAQAMQMGTPVIGSDRGSLPEVIGDAGFLVDPHSVDAIADAMRRLFYEPSLRAQFAERGRERAREFSPQRQAEAHLSVYKELLGKT